MFIDSSALVSIVVAEDDGSELALRIAAAASRVTSAITQVEASIAAGRHFDRDYAFGTWQVADFIERAGVEVVDVPADMVDEVLSAYRRFGKGTGHPAQLNFGDCFSYAFARRLDVPLLFKGRDFAQTDVERA